MKKRAALLAAGMALLMAVAAAPLLFWLGKLGGGIPAKLLLLCLWLGIPGALPLSHSLRSERVRIALHLLAEAFLAFALYLWLSAALAWLLWLPLREGAWQKPCACVFGGCFLVLYGGGMVNAACLRTRRHTVDVGLGQPLRVALLSDLHLGFFTTRGMLRRIVRRTEREQPDLILIAGDFFDMDFDSLRHKAECAALLRSLRSRYGVLGCLGNHDHYLTDPRKDDFLRSAGISILADEGVSVCGATVFGRRDVRDPLRKPWSAVKPEGEAPLLVLDHNPAPYRDYAGSADLLLCGHTHGGQTFPMDFLQKAFLHYPIYGVGEQDGVRVAVTAGAGFWGPPVRFGVSNEVMLLTLK